MDTYTAEKLKHLSNTEVVRRMLIKYFMDKGFTDSFDRHLYPAILQDLPMAIPQIANKIEIAPYAEEIDSQLGKAALGWNLFVLGNQRMYLGQTYYNDLQGLARQIQSGFIQVPEGGPANSRLQTTPRKVITFIARVLGSHDAGYTDLSVSQNAPQMAQPYQSKSSMMGMPQQFFARSSYGS